MKRPAVLLVSVLVALLGCGSYAWLSFSGSGCEFPNGSPDECARSVGFEPVLGAEIHDANVSGWQDTTYTFKLVGTPEAIDRALVSAGFTEPLTRDPGAGARFQGDDDLEGLTDLRYGQDQWNSPPSQRERRVLRATLPGDEGEEALFVQAH